MTRHDTQLLNNGLLAVRRHSINKLLRSVFGIARLREGQQRVIDSVLDGKDTLAIMPTGGGKSLCYQIPAHLLQGLTVVVSPLISLMKDQLGKLDELGVRACQLNSSLHADEEHAALEAIATGSCEIVFCTPERLASPAFLAVLKQTKVALVAIDEAHCISQWGHDFRPAYIEMAAAIAALGQPPVLALTATATDEVMADIGRQLNRPRMNVINTGIYRPNLHYDVVQVTNLGEKFATARRLVAESAGVGIVYAATVKAAEEMHRLLEEAGESVTLYHGKLPANERRANQDLFMTGARRVMVATNAFGMGIDKADTRFVIHLQIPANLESYYQESGRAGRDGQDARCTLLFLQHDKRLQQFFLVKHYPDAAEIRSVYEAACELAGTGAVTTAGIEAKRDELNEAKIKVCLKLLKDGKLVRQNRKLEFVITQAAPTAATFSALADVYVQKQEHDRDALEKMVGYAVSGFCRWKLMLDYFGDEAPGFERCCRCDNCLNPPSMALDDIVIEDDEFAPAEVAEPAAPAFEAGMAVVVPKYGQGVVASVAGEQVGIGFPDGEVRTFMSNFVQRA